MQLNTNKKKQYQYIVDIYNEHKQSDIPDTFIIRVIFPRHHIYISYRQWMRIKGHKPSEFETNQMTMF